MTSLLLENPLAVYLDDPKHSCSGIVIKDSRIFELLKVGQSPSIEIDQLFDCSNYVVLPGLINSHHHFYQTLTRAYPSALHLELFDWLKALYPVWSNLQP